jgi:hypothetical protein
LPPSHCHPTISTSTSHPTSSRASKSIFSKLLSIFAYRLLCFGVCCSQSTSPLLPSVESAVDVWFPITSPAVLTSSTAVSLASSRDSTASGLPTVGPSSATAVRPSSNPVRSTRPLSSNTTLLSSAQIRSASSFATKPGYIAPMSQTSTSFLAFALGAHQPNRRSVFHAALQCILTAHDELLTSAARNEVLLIESCRTVQSSNPWPEVVQAVFEFTPTSHRPAPNSTSVAISTLKRLYRRINEDRTLATESFQSSILALSSLHPSPLAQLPEMKKVLLASMLPATTQILSSSEAQQVARARAFAAQPSEHTLWSIVSALPSGALVDAAFPAAAACSEPVVTPSGPAAAPSVSSNAASMLTSSTPSRTMSADVVASVSRYLSQLSPRYVSAVCCIIDT